MKKLLVLLTILLILPSALAVVDLLNPVDNTVTSATTMSFEYYVSLPDLLSCDINVNDQFFPDPNPESNAINSVQIQGISAGSYVWNVTCSGNATETSASRSFVIDTERPTLAVVSPENESTYTTIPIDIIPNDETDDQLTCTIKWNNHLIDEVEVGANTHFAQDYNSDPGTGDLLIECTDDAGNSVSEMRVITLEPELFLDITLDKQEYGIDEPVLLTVNTIPGANIIIDICPNEQGFVQCTSALIDNDEFPQTITLPYLNKTGGYLVDALATLGSNTLSEQVTYDIVNSISVLAQQSSEELNETITLTASADNGVPPYIFTWTLSNGTVRSGVSTVDVFYAFPGEYNITLSVTDDAGNEKSTTYTITIDPVYGITFLVIDNETQAPIEGAEVDVDDIVRKTLNDGVVLHEVDEGKHKIFVSADGYEYYIEERRFNKSETIIVPLRRSTGGPQVTITVPEQSATLGSPVGITYLVSHTEEVACTLLHSDDGAWFTENGTMNVSDSTAKTFTRNYEEGEHNVRIECVDKKGTVGSSPLVTFFVGDVPVEIQEEVVEAPVEEDLVLQRTLEVINKLLSGLDNYGKEEKQAIGLLEVDKKLRNFKRAVQQAIRDLDSIRFRTDIDDEQKQEERDKILSSLDELYQKTPQRIDVLESKTFVKYVDEDEMEGIAEELAGLDGMMEDSKKLAKLLWEDQQKFTISTKLMQVKYTYPSSEETVTIITRSFTYADDLEDGYSILEIIPKKVTKTADDITMITAGEVLKEDPILRFPTEETITYVIPKRIDFTRLETVKTIIARTYVEGDTNLLVGFAIFGEGISVFGIPLLAIVALLVFIYLAYTFNLLNQLKYVIYKLRKNEQVHYLRVMINDAHDHLASQNYEKAEMLYKEIRMTYDTLSELPQNDLHEDVMDLVHKMDNYYFNMIMIEMDGHIREGDLEAAIFSYEKLTGTYERLDPKRQRQLVENVTAMARRLGLEVKG